MFMFLLLTHTVNTLCGQANITTYILQQQHSTMHRKLKESSLAQGSNQRKFGAGTKGGSALRYDPEDRGKEFVTCAIGP